MKYVLSILLICLLGFLIYKNVRSIVERIKEKKASKVQVDVHDIENNDIKEHE